MARSTLGRLTGAGFATMVAFAFQASPLYSATPTSVAITATDSTVTTTTASSAITDVLANLPNQLAKVLESKDFIANAKIVGRDKPTSSVSGSTKTSTYAYHMFLNFKDRRVPAVLLSMAETKKDCVDSSPAEASGSSSSCYPSVELKVEGPLVTYGPTFRQDRPETFLEGKQQLVFKLSTSSSTATLKSNFSVESLHFETGVQRLLQQVFGEQMPVTQNVILLEMARFLRDVNERILG